MYGIKPHSMKRKFYFFVLVTFLCNALQAQQIDPNFKPIIGGAAYIYDAVLQIDQKLLISGTIRLVDSSSAGNLVRLNADGSLDPTFSLDEAITNQLENIIVQADGKVLAVMRVGNGDRTLIRLNVDGSLDDSYTFGAGDLIAIDDLTFDADGNLFFSSYNRVYKMSANGLVDESYQVSTSGGSIYYIQFDANGKLVVSGDFTAINGVSKNGMARLNAEGTVDGTFDIGAGADREIERFEILPSGKILVIGRFQDVAGSNYNQLARLNSDGSVDGSFNNDAGFNTGNGINDLTIDGSGKIVLVGNFQSPTTRIVRLLADGTIDNTFDEGTGFTSDALFPDVEKILINDAGKLIAVGSFNRYNGTLRIGLAQLLANGTLDTTYDPQLAGTGSVFVSAQQEDGKIVIGGSFLSVGGTEQINIARLNADGTVDASFNTGIGADDEVNALAIQDDGKILVGGEFAKINSEYGGGIVRLNADGSIDETFSCSLSRQYSSDGVFKFYVQTDGDIVIGGAFYAVNGTNRSYFARLNPDGSLDNSFNSNDDVPARLRDFELLSNGNYIIAGNDSNDPGFLEMRDENGDIINAFNKWESSMPRVNDIAIQQDGKIIVGGYDSFGSGFLVDNNVSVFRLNADGSLDNSFNFTRFDYITSVALLPGGDMLVSSRENGLERKTSDGLTDEDFPWSTNGQVHYISSYEGDYLLSGSFTKIGDNEVFGMARLTSTLVNAPSDLSVLEENPIINWTDNASDETGFEVFRANGANSDYSLIASLSANVTTFTDEDSDPDEQYFYKVRAIREAEVSAFTSSVAFPAYAPPTIYEFQQTTVGTNTIGLSWLNNIDDANYLELIRSEEGQPDEIIYILNNATSYTDSNLSSGTTYTYSLRNVTANGISEPVSLIVSTLSESLQRTGAVSFVIDGTTYIGLGRNDSGLLQEFIQLDVKTYATANVAAFPGVARENAVAFVLNGKAYVGLGEDELGNALADFYEYDPVADSWSSLNDFSGGARFGAVAFVAGGKAYVGTGDDGSTELADFYQYNVSNDSWSATASFSGDKRREAAAFSANNKGYVVGGFYFDGSSFQLSDIQEFDTETQTWREVVFADFNLSFNYATAFTYGNNAYIAYGNKGDIVEVDLSDFSTTNLNDVLGIDEGEIGAVRADAIAFTVDGVPYFSGGRAGFIDEKIYGDLFNLSVLNNKPTSIELSANILDENTMGEALIGELSATDPDDTDTHTFELVVGNGVTDADNGVFGIDGNELVYIGETGVNYEEQSFLRVFVQATDSRGATYRESLTINIWNVNDAPKLSIDETTYDLEENPAVNTVIGTFSATDEDGDAVSFSIVEEDITAISVNAEGQIVVIDPSGINFEERSTIVFNVQASDFELSSDPIEITITILDVNEAPTLSLGTGSAEISEDASNGTLVVALIAEDEDGDALTYHLTDAEGVFSINANAEVVVSNAELLDFETTPTYSLSVVADDGELQSAPLDFEITVINVNEGLTISAAEVEISLDEDAEEGFLLTTLTGNDADGDEISFEIISGNTENAFRIDIDELVVNNPRALDVRENELFTLVISGTDGEFTDEVEITVTINDVPDFINAVKDAITTSTPYPNPVTDQFIYLQLISQEIDEVILFDNTGKKYTVDWSISRQTLKIDSDQLESGLYTLMIKGKGRVQQFKINKR